MGVVLINLVHLFKLYSKYNLSNAEFITMALYIANVNACEPITGSSMGKTLLISEKTVKSHLTQVFHKVGVKNRSQLYAKISKDLSNIKLNDDSEYA